MKLPEIKKSTWQIIIVVAAAVLLVALPPIAPYISKAGKIPLSPLQILYAVLSSEIALAVYVWGVGNWSRFEPPNNVSGPSAPPGAPVLPAGGPQQGPALAGQLAAGVAPPANAPPQKDGH